MPINSDKTGQWKSDIAASVDMFNKWFMDAAPRAFRDTREKVTSSVENHLIASNDGRKIDSELLLNIPQALSTLRMATCPPLARERLSGLAGVSKSLVNRLESGNLPKMSRDRLIIETDKLAVILRKLIDDNLFPWLENDEQPNDSERYRASTIIADRCCTAVANPIVKNAQEQRQLALVKAFLESHGYFQADSVSGPKNMAPGTFSFRMNVPVKTRGSDVNIPVDILIQPHQPREDRMPVLIEAKSAGDYTNVNKRRKEEAQKANQIRATYGEDVPFYLFLCGYFDAGYLGYSASEGIDWIWEHRLRDLVEVGL